MLAKLPRAAALRAALACAIAGPLSALGLSLGGCNSNEPPPFNPRQLQADERRLARENMTPPMAKSPTTMESDFLDANGRVKARHKADHPDFALRSPAADPNARRVSLQDVLHLAAVNSLDVKVAAFQPAIDANRITEAEARFDPALFWKPQYTYTDVVAPTANDPLLNPTLQNTTRYKAFQSQFGLKQNLPSGGDVTLTYNQSVFDRKVFGQANNFVNPFYQNELMLQLNQPLLQNFGSDINRARIVIAANTHKGSLLDFRLALEKNVADIEEAYWQLAQAEREINVQETLLARTWDMANILYVRHGEGVSNVEIAQANAELEARNQQLATLRAAVYKLSNRIKSLVNDPSLPVSSPVVLLAKDAPVDEPLVFDVNEQIQTALENRAELAQQQLKIDSAQVTFNAAKNNELPVVNLTGQFGVIGVGASENAAIRDNAKAHYFDFAIGLDIELPLGNREAKAIFQRTLLQRLQAVTQYRQLIEQVTREVRDAQNDVDANWAEVVSARQTRFARAVALSTFETRFREGVDPMTPPLVQTRLQLQSQAADAERSEADSLAKYNISISALERAKGTILRYNNIVMQEEQIPYGARGRKGY